MIIKRKLLKKEIDEIQNHNVKLKSALQNIITFIKTLDDENLKKKFNAVLSKYFSKKSKS